MSRNRASATPLLAFTTPKQIKKRSPDGDWSSTGSFRSSSYVLAISSVASLTTVLFQTELPIVASIEFLSEPLYSSAPNVLLSVF